MAMVHTTGKLLIRAELDLCKGFIETLNEYKESMEDSVRNLERDLKKVKQLEENDEHPGEWQYESAIPKADHIQEGIQGTLAKYFVCFDFAADSLRFQANKVAWGEELADKKKEQDNG